MPQLRIVLGYQQGHVFSLDNRPFLIGRDPNADVVLDPDSPASRRHAEIVHADDGWRVRDLGSINGTFVNGEPASEVTLGHNDELVIGENVFIFENTEPDAARIAEAASRVVLSETRGFPNRPEARALVHGMAEQTKKITAQVQARCGASSRAVRELMTALIADGHVLLPGGGDGGKTSLAQVLARCAGLTCESINFAASPDLVLAKANASDEAPFANLLVSDQITRSHPGSEALLMEMMQERVVTTCGRQVPIPSPFVVLAPLSPMDADDAVPLSEGQLDRFMFSVDAEIPNDFKPSDTTPAEKILRLSKVQDLQRAARELPVEDMVVDYAVRLVRATRPSDGSAPEFVRKYLYSGAGARGAQDLVVAAKAHAVMEGRLIVSLDDVRAMARAVLRHRIFANFTAEAAGITGEKLIEQLLAEIPAEIASDED